MCFDMLLIHLDECIEGSGHLLGRFTFKECPQLGTRTEAGMSRTVWHVCQGCPTKHKIVNLFKTFFCSSAFISVGVFNVWPKTTLLPVWPRDAKGLGTPGCKPSAPKCPWLGKIRPCDLLFGCKLLYQFLQLSVSVSPFHLPRNFPSFLTTLPHFENLKICVHLTL